MTMDYLDAYMSIASKTPKENLREDYQELVDEVFMDSSDWYTIKEETTFGSETLVDVDVRINNVVFGRTGLPQGDDFKVILFQDLGHVVHIGYFYYFDNNYWIVTNTMTTKALTPSATVRRCNNTLRWQALDGSVYSVPCSTDYGIKENRDYSTGGSTSVSPSGLLAITTQLNARTNLIKPNQRFLFGNPDNYTAFRLMGGGIENFNNIQTGDNTSFGFLKLTLNADYVNEDTDDIVNGIADRIGNLYTVELSESSIDGNSSDTLQLYAVVKLNDDSVARAVDWSSSDDLVATVDSSGVVTFVGVGSCIITASLDGDASVNDTCSVDVVVPPVTKYQVVISPSTNYILENDEEIYNVKLLLNGAEQVDTFIFSVESGNGVPTDNYTLSTIDGNNFKVENHEKYLNEDLVIECVSGIHTELFSINLKGMW